MHIIVGNDNISELSKKYVVLELDTFNVNDEIIPTFCIIDSKTLHKSSGINLRIFENNKDLHSKLISNYKRGNFGFCVSAIKHLHGTFDGELDSFYTDFDKRLLKLMHVESTDEWDGTILK